MFGNFHLFHNPLKTKSARGFSIVLFSLCLIYVLPIIMADRYYIDDLGRSKYGYLGWSSNGRPVADWLMSAIGFGEYQLDVSPLFQLISIVVFVFCSFQFFKTNMKHVMPGVAAITMFLAFANPFFLENLSYKFDCLPMTLAMSLLMLPYTKKSISYGCFAFSCCMIILSLCLYQAAIGFYVCLAIIEFVRFYVLTSYESIDDAWFLYKLVLVRLSQLLTSYLVYSIFIVPNFLGVDDYNKSHSKLINFDVNGISIVSHNVSIFTSKISNYLHSVPFFLLFALLVLCFGCLFFIVFNRVKTVKKTRLFTTIIPSVIFISCPAVSFFSSFIHLSLLQDPVFSPRTLISFSGVILFAFWLVATRFKKIKNIILFFIPFVLFAMIYSYSYGNALKGQKSHEAFIASSLAMDVANIDPSGTKSILIKGSLPLSPVTMSAFHKYPSLGELVPVYMSNGWYWGYMQLTMYGISNPWGGEADEKLITSSCKTGLSKKNIYYSLINIESSIIIDFTKKC